MGKTLTEHRAEVVRAMTEGRSIESAETIAMSYLKANNGEVKLEEMVQAAYNMTHVDADELRGAISSMLKQQEKKGAVTHVRDGYWAFNR